MHRTLFLLIALLVGAVPARAQAPLPDYPELEVYLLTMGQGDQVWEMFGHNAIWIRDRANDSERVYNYGVFDFNSPGYWNRFVRGTWLYQLDASDIYSTAAQYEWLNRTLVAHELNLTMDQRRELQQFLEWNLRPENREYRYDYFRDNCSTRIRDAIDRALGGSLRAATENLPTGTTYRWHSRRLIADDRAAYVGMNIGLGPAADRPISMWEEMFLPEKLLEHARRHRVVGADGSDQPLLLGEHVIYQAVARQPERAAPPVRWPVFLLVGLALAGALLLLGSGSPRSGAARFGFSVVAALWALLTGTGGVVLFALWAFTDHDFAHRNENLLQFNPLALGLVLLLPALAYGARWARRPVMLLALLVAGMSLLGVVLQILPWFDQANIEALALAVPVHVALAWVVYRLAGGPAVVAEPAPPAQERKRRGRVRVSAPDRSSRR
jgi:hypothetical protein